MLLALQETETINIIIIDEETHHHLLDLRFNNNFMTQWTFSKTLKKWLKACLSHHLLSSSRKKDLKEIIQTQRKSQSIRGRHLSQKWFININNKQQTQHTHKAQAFIILCHILNPSLTLTIQNSMKIKFCSKAMGLKETLHQWVESMILNCQIPLNWDKMFLIQEWQQLPTSLLMEISAVIWNTETCQMSQV